jgi:hypothetical protein
VILTWCCNADGVSDVYPRGKDMHSLLKPTLLVSLQQNPAGLLIDLGILVTFIVLLAVK